jgi:hypothetical protein
MLEFLASFYFNLSGLILCPLLGNIILLSGSVVHNALGMKGRTLASGM